MIQRLFTGPSSLLVHHSALPKSLLLLFLSCFSFMLNSSQFQNTPAPCSFIFSQLCFYILPFLFTLHTLPFLNSPSILQLELLYFLIFLPSTISPPSPLHLSLYCLHPAIQMKTPLPGVLSHPWFLLAFYQTPGHRKAAIYQGCGVKPRGLKVLRRS